ncbi:hypothetical protein WME79_33845 [Sorangium sp. So ce726]|uniref:hypothetical protein n=1 Tax=Sorangium sp. So ce726 TaxID=3133319 RepID=UPI003F629D7E
MKSSVEHHHHTHAHGASAAPRVRLSIDLAALREVVEELANRQAPVEFEISFRSRSGPKQRVSVAE